MQKWLQDYAYRISITWDVFAFSGVAVLVIALMTICYQAIKGAIAHPVKSLRSVVGVTARATLSMGNGQGSMSQWVNGSMCKSNYKINL